MEREDRFAVPLGHGADNEVEQRERSMPEPLQDALDGFRTGHECGNLLGRQYLVNMEGSMEH